MGTHQAGPAPIPSEKTAVRAFEAEARRMGLDPKDPWVGGYVAYEWDKLRLILRAYGIDIHGRRVLEFGCNYGASSIVLSFLGAEVHGVDVDAAAVALARCNAAQYGRTDISLSSVADCGQLPFPDGHFDFALCNSVLEYVSRAELARVIAELQRLVKPGGRLLITGTSSRLAPKEVHSGRWIVNYLPGWIDRRLGRDWQRGLNPFTLRGLVIRGFCDEDAEDGGRKWLRARAALRGAAHASPLFRAIARCARLLRIGPGWLTPNISVMLRRFDATEG